MTKLVSLSWLDKHECFSETSTKAKTVVILKSVDVNKNAKTESKTASLCPQLTFKLQPFVNIASDVLLKQQPSLLKLVLISFYVRVQ